MSLTLFDSWIQYEADCIWAPVPPARPNPASWRFVVTNGLTMTRTMSKAEIISAELLNTNGYQRRPYVTGSGGSAGTWDAAQLRYEANTVSQSVTVTASEQWSGLVFWADSAADSAARSFTTANVNITTDRITLTAHGISSASEVVVTSTGTRPGGLAANTLYFVQVIDANTISLHSNAALSAIVDITSVGTGTHHLRLAGGRVVGFRNFSVGTIGAGASQPFTIDQAWMNVGDVNGV